ncbi:MAG TPA: FIST N-terminal domain-containing protein [Terriglobales bacterium]|nr:FIST N-terminal domain-containing protein [Terriglobales bacterium]
MLEPGTVERVANGPVQNAIRRGMSMKTDVTAAVQEILNQIASDDSEIVLLFCSPQFHVADIAAAIRSHGTQQTVIGCTTAGEITPVGHRHGSITGISLPRQHFAVSLQVSEHLANFDIAAGISATKELLQSHENVSRRFDQPRTFALLINDGLAMREEALASAVGDALGHVPLIGGSAGNNPTSEEPNIFVNDRVLTNAAILVLASTDLDFRVFQTQHFEPLEHKLVVTRADPSRRLVMQLNAEPAAQEYAQMLGLKREDLNPYVFASHPLVVRAGGRHYVRGIQKVDDADCLQFFCAIDEGIVLSIARSGDLVTNLENLFDRLNRDLGKIDAVVAFDCILRYVEMEQTQLLPRVSDLLSRNNVIGFNTYGEQFGMMHMSQTFTGIAFGGNAS